MHQKPDAKLRMLQHALELSLVMLAMCVTLAVFVSDTVWVRVMFGVMSFASACECVAAYAAYTYILRRRARQDERNDEQK